MAKVVCPKCEEEEWELHKVVEATSTHYNVSLYNNKHDTTEDESEDAPDDPQMVQFLATRKELLTNTEATICTCNDVEEFDVERVIRHVKLECRNCGYAFEDPEVAEKLWSEADWC
jgi:predicted nucleic-acid-binding Zn-ribbon protein